ncbi:Methionyl-tRNA formyltransferase [hydrothermal vent metagenome]|uniref:methionyl-tRNA formyltransferase n=1 Tax=hydrothermal vent metagenome TaxID=652676 RepID=A0A3B0RGF4_9ZZZZ
MSLKIAFMGTPEFAACTLGALVANGHEVVCVYTRAPKPKGRGKQVQQSAVHQMAESLGIPVRTPQTLRDAQMQAEFAALQIDLAVVVAYGMILPVEVLQSPKYGCFNLHGSNLPRWRGAAPIQRAIMAGDQQTAVQVMQMDAGLDTGDILLSETVAISDTDTSGSLHDKMMQVGADLVIRALSALERDALAPCQQSDTGITYADKIDKAETRIDWNKPAQQLDRHIRGLSPFPGAWFEIETAKGKIRVKALHSQVSEQTGAPGAVLDDCLCIATGQGSLHLLRVQAAGGTVQDGAVFARGRNLHQGDSVS